MTAASVQSLKLHVAQVLSSIAKVSVHQQDKLLLHVVRCLWVLRQAYI